MARMSAGVFGQGAPGRRIKGVRSDRAWAERVEDGHGLVLLVGQAPNSTTDPEWPVMYREIAELAGLSYPLGYLKFFDRVNVLREYPGRDGTGDAFPMGEARRAVEEEIMPELWCGRYVVLLGRQVARAFGVRDDLPWFKFEVGIPHPHSPMGVAYSGNIYGAVEGAPCFSVAVCPHPSGRSRWWKEEKNVEEARNFFSLLRMFLTHGVPEGFNDA